MAEHEHERERRDRQQLNKPRPSAHQELSARLSAVTAGMASIATPVTASVSEVLQRIADVARELVGAEFCALGIGTDPSVSFHPWVFSGMSEDVARAIGTYPRPVGLLGSVPHTNSTIRVKDLGNEPRFGGFPSHHPAMHSFLGVPIRVGTRGVGNLYLTNKLGADEFSSEDQQIAEMLAAHAGVAMESARLYQEVHQRAVELEEEKKRRETFVSAVAHELRNPLAVVIGSASLLLRRWDELEPERLRKTVETIWDQGNRLNRLSSDLLEASRINAGHFPVETAPMDLVATARDVVEPLSQVTDHHLVLEAPESLMGVWDRDRVAQALTNLVSNAVKYSPEGTTIRVRVERVSDQAVVKVTDQGPGIAADEIPLLFQPYSRFYRESRARGLGLGLYITKGIVEAHGGHILVESPGPDKGSTFTFSLPLDIADRNESPRDRAGAEPPSPRS